MNALHVKAALDEIADRLTRAELELALEGMVLIAEKLAATRAGAGALSTKAQGALISWRYSEKQRSFVTSDQHHAVFNKHVSMGLGILADLRKLVEEPTVDVNRLDAGQPIAPHDASQSQHAVKSNVRRAAQTVLGAYRAAAAVIAKRMRAQMRRDRHKEEEIEKTMAMLGMLFYVILAGGVLIAVFALFA